MDALILIVRYIHLLIFLFQIFKKYWLHRGLKDEDKWLVIDRVMTAVEIFMYQGTVMYEQYMIMQN
jgi:hypothetical protein